MLSINHESSASRQLGRVTWFPLRSGHELNRFDSQLMAVGIERGGPAGRSMAVMLDRQCWLNRPWRALSRAIPTALIRSPSKCVAPRSYSPMLNVPSCVSVRCSSAAGVHCGPGGSAFGWPGRSLSAVRGLRLALGLGLARSEGPNEWTGHMTRYPSRRAAPASRKASPGWVSGTVITGRSGIALVALGNSAAQGWPAKRLL